jgi:hypothetical protein
MSGGFGGAASGIRVLGKRGSENERASILSDVHESHGLPR